MPRPKTCRRICSYPRYWRFAPADGHCGESVQLMLDEYEAIRLIDHQKMTQEECAEAMGVSRATVTSIYESARAKLADALISGKQLRISGGAQHFGRAEQFAFCDVADGTVRHTRVVETGGVSRIALVGFLRAAEVDTLLCGGIGENARNALCATGIRMESGLTGSVEEVVEAYLKDTKES